MSGRSGGRRDEIYWTGRTVSPDVGQTPVVDDETVERVECGPDRLKRTRKFSDSLRWEG